MSICTQTQKLDLDSEQNNNLNASVYFVNFVRQI